MNQQTSSNSTSQNQEDGGVTKSDFLKIMVFLLIVSGLFMWRNQKEYDYDQQEIKNIVNAASPQNLDALATEIGANATAIQDATVKAQAEKTIKEDDASFVIKIAMDPGLLKVGQNLSRALNIFFMLGEGELKELLRSALCKAWDNQFDFCNSDASSVATNAETNVAEKPTSPIQTTFIVKRTDKDAGEKTKAKTVKKFNSLAEAMKALQQALASLKKLKEDFAVKRITAKKFKEDYALLAGKIRFEILHPFRKFLKDTYKGKLPAKVYTKTGTDFQPNWEEHFRGWMKTQPNGDKLKQTLNEYDDVNKVLKEMDDLVK